MLIKTKKVQPPEITTEKLKQYIKDRMLFRKEQFVVEPTIEHPNGALFGEVIQEWQEHHIFKPLDLKGENGVPKYKLAYIQLPKKDLCVNTPILTLDGWKLLKDVKVGDFVFNEKGLPCKVIDMTDFLYNKKCYEITFSDNTKIKASSDHEWTVWDSQAKDSYRSYHKNHNKQSNPEWPDNWHVWKSSDMSKGNGTEDFIHKKSFFIGAKNLTTDFLFKNYKTKNDKKPYNYLIPVTKPLIFETQNLPIDPWCLGYLLGDGDSNGCGRVACDPRDKDWLKLEFENRGFKLSKHDSSDKYSFIINDIYIKWKNLNLFKNKHIPEVYLKSDIKQRRDLLCGLIDSDGTIDKQGGFRFNNSNKTLFYDAVKLVRSLGYVPKIYINDKKFFNNKKCKTGYEFRIMSKIPIVFSPRKLKNIKFLF